MNFQLDFSQLSLREVVFAVLAFLVIASAAITTFSRSLVNSAFALLGTLAGTAALYVLLYADFLAATQVIVYIGGILVLFLFAVMLTNRIEDVNVSNRSLSYAVAIPVGLGVFGLSIYALLMRAPFESVPVRDANPTTARIGDALLSTHLLPFELVSVVLLAAMIGAVVIARREVRPEMSARSTLPNVATVSSNDPEVDP